MLCGITTRWKQTIAYEYTENSYDANYANQIIQQILVKCEAINLNSQTSSSSKQMPKSQKDCPYRKRYNQDDIEAALEAISNGMSKKKASVMFKVPRPTLQFRLSNKFKKSSLGPDTYLTKEEEEVLVQWIIESYRKGFPRRKDDIQISVKDFLDKAPRSNPFLQNKPGDCWYRNFLRRHPVLTHRTTEAVTAASANIFEDDIKKWFLQIEQYLQEKSYFDILQDPERVFNGDETNLQLCPKLGKVVAPKGATNVYEVDKGLAKSNVTCLGKRQLKASQTKEVEAGPFITSKKFGEVVGEAKMNAIRNFDINNSDEFSEDFLALHRLWQIFLENLGAGDAAYSRSCPATANTNNYSTDVDIPTDFIDIVQISNDELYQDKTHTGSNDKKDFVDSFRNDEQFEERVEESEESQVLSVDNLPIQFEDGMVLESAPPGLLREILQWPKTPERKGKK
ncbi:helix-turn-helix psq domain [Holotrichia oblita]|uniref:Helix-turn-helix psq domain n=1 Tax=Holotrichia oblita TaxID=644536 RepID=A0ACB9T016_HOLOL|nr:helix-turn-helix psq domain [Holotrichia oblita]